MSSITQTPVLSAPKRVTETVLAIAERFVTIWSQARAARLLAEEFLSLSDEALMARGTTREAVVDRIRRVMTDRV